MNLNPKPGRGGSPDPHSKKMKYDEGYHFITIVTNKRVKAFRFLLQYEKGEGDYTKLRRKMFKGETVERLILKMKKERQI